MKKDQAAQLLREKKLKATPARVAILQFLDKQKVPVGIEKILRKAPSFDKVTIYRMMQAFVDVGIVLRHDIGHGHDDYELARGEHHHHVVCRICGSVEDIDIPQEEMLEKQALTQAKKFAIIDQHQISFFGVCRKCKKKRS